MTSDHPTVTWPELVRQVRLFSNILQGGADEVARLLREVRAGVSWEAHLVDAYGHAMLTIEEAMRTAGLLAERLHDAEPVIPDEPEPPLQAVLAAIVAEGHIDLELRHQSQFAIEYPAAAWACRSDTDSERVPSQSASREEWVAYRERVEQGEVTASAPLAAAQARLDQIRELHAAKLAKDGLGAELEGAAEADRAADRDAADEGQR